MLGQYVIATLALFATAGISASALRPEGPLEVVGDDIQHTVEASLHLLDDAGALQDGYATAACQGSFFSLAVRGLHDPNGAHNRVKVDPERKCRLHACHTCS